MLLAALGKGRDGWPDRPLAIEGEGSLTFAAAHAWAEDTASSWAPAKDVPLFVYHADSCRVVVALAAAEGAGRTACVLSRTLPPGEVPELVEALGGGELLHDVGPGAFPQVEEARLSPRNAAGPTEAAKAALPGGGALVILTTGTTGRPKAARHTWERLFAQVREAPPRRWLLCYPLNHFAGITVVAHVVAAGGTLVVPGSRGMAEMAEAASRHGVDAISATPTFWRLFADPLRSATAEHPFSGQITLGGEPVPQQLLDRLRGLFPDAAIRHVYATTELGSCFSVSDGRAGFPVDYLHRSVGNVTLRVEEGELLVQAPHRMTGYADGRDSGEGEWVATGDMVEVVEDRVLFRGRRTEVINVGGVKVFPQRIEETILRVPGVQAVRVLGQENPVTGQLVAARVELAPGAEEAQVVSAVREACRAGLSRYEAPRLIEVVERLPRLNEKIARGEAS